jgi:hypothetical protein
MAGTIATVDDLPVQGIGQTIARLGVHDYLALRGHPPPMIDRCASH